MKSATIVLGVLGLASCATTPAAGPSVWTSRRQAEVDDCNATGNATSCQNAGDNYFYDQEPKKAVAFYSRGCAAGSLPSCKRAIELGDKASRLPACKLGDVNDCSRWLGETSVDDPEWASVVEYLRTTAPRTFDEALKSMAAHLGPVEFWARRACDAEPLNLESCTNAAWLQVPPSLRIELRRKACDVGSAVVCEAIAYELFMDVPPQIEKGNAYLHKACALGSASACDSEVTRAKADQARTAEIEACKGGDAEACARIGERVTDRTLPKLPQP